MTELSKKIFSSFILSSLFCQFETFYTVQAAKTFNDLLSNIFLADLKPSYQVSPLSQILTIILTFITYFTSVLTLLFL